MTLFTEKALFDACRQGDHARLAGFMTEHPEAANWIETAEGLTPLATVARSPSSGSAACAHILLEQGANPAKGGLGRAPLHWALAAYPMRLAGPCNIVMGIFDIIQEALPKEGRWPSTENGLPLIHVACGRDSIGLITALLQRQAPAIETDADGNTALHFCYRWQFAHAARALANLWTHDPVNVEGLTPGDILKRMARQQHLRQHEIEHFLLTATLPVAQKDSTLPAARQRL